MTASSGHGHFSAGARTALTMAHEEATHLNKALIGTEHLLLGLIRVDPHLAGVLAAHGVTRARFLNSLKSIYAEGTPADEAGEEVRLTSQAKSAIERGVEAARLGTGTIEPVHLLLGVLGDADGIVARVFAAYGVDRQKISIEAIDTPPE